MGPVFAAKVAYRTLHVMITRAFSSKKALCGKVSITTIVLISIQYLFYSLQNIEEGTRMLYQLEVVTANLVMLRLGMVVMTGHLSHL